MVAFESNLTMILIIDFLLLEHAHAGNLYYPMIIE